MHPNRQQQSEARQRVDLILKVRSGLITAADAARQLGVSRKTYYKWEKRAFSGMLEGLSDRSSGRPALVVDTEKEELKKRVMELTRELRLQQQRLELGDLLASEAKKKG